MPGAWIVVRPVNHATERIVFVFASHRNVFADAQGNGTGEIDIGFDPYGEVAPVAHFKKDAFVRAARSETHTEDARNLSAGDGFLTRCLCLVEIANAGVVGPASGKE